MARYGRMSRNKSRMTHEGLKGFAVGGAVTGALELLQNKGMLPSWLSFYTPYVGGAIVGAGAFLLSNKRTRSARAVGALIGGTVMPYVADAVVSKSINPAAVTAGWGFAPRTLPAGMGAPLFMNPRLQGMNGPIFNNPNTQMANYNFARLAAAQGFGDDNEDGNFPAP